MATFDLVTSMTWDAFLVANPAWVNGAATADQLWISAAAELSQTDGEATTTMYAKNIYLGDNIAGNAAVKSGYINFTKAGFAVTQSTAGAAAMIDAEGTSGFSLTGTLASNITFTANAAMSHINDSSEATASGFTVTQTYVTYAQIGAWPAAAFNLRAEVLTMRYCTIPTLAYRFLTHQNNNTAWSWDVQYCTFAAKSPYIQNTSGTTAFTFSNNTFTTQTGAWVEFTATLGVMPGWNLSSNLASGIVANLTPNVPSGDYWSFKTSDTSMAPVIPTTVAAADAGLGPILTVTWANGVSFGASDLVVAHDDTTGAHCGVALGTAGTMSVVGVQDTAKTVHLHGVSIDFTYSAASATATATPTLGAPYSSSSSLSGSSCSSGSESSGSESSASIVAVSSSSSSSTSSASSASSGSSSSSSSTSQSSASSASSASSSSSSSTSLSSGSSSSSTQSSGSSSSLSSSSSSSLGVLPSTPTLAVVDNADGTGATATISGSDGSTTNTIWYCAEGGGTLIDGGSRTGDGDVAVAITTLGVYYFIATSEDAGGLAVSVNLVERTITDSDAVTTVSDEWDNIYEHGGTLIIERKTESVNAHGAREFTWATAVTTKGWLQPASSNDITRFGARGLSITHKIFVPENPGATEGDRVDYGGTKFLIRGVVNQLREGKLWVLYAEEQV